MTINIEGYTGYAPYVHICSTKLFGGFSIDECKKRSVPHIIDFCEYQVSNDKKDMMALGDARFISLQQGLEVCFRIFGDSVCIAEILKSPKCKVLLPMVEVLHAEEVVKCRN